ncbi:AraC family transcriptional regulator [Micromonospora sp. DR5-3]|uniref:helix-turn-helix domain-containing protein n=1 Tax=unclassified Micromonospora TaxID=2617518 RepID=UPI0011D42773|nr:MULTISPECIES: AraC family transcriptional regulator [unclassified Micromonospora]MCW3818279.1 AraC family transcriptional regulator [Micromonospora sp. DR5-3]TYC21502.1 helix-turn-helix transcriptional regulator [Micromonospora sp. MP36]
MQDASEKAVLRAIATMHERLGEQLTVDDMARAAMFSKFHFTRMFQRVTGVSPGRFLSALRLQRAKELLVSTPMNVADISVSVGYNSVGTFSSRFSRSVGMSPTIFRQRAGYASEIRADSDGVRLSDASLSCEVHPAGRDENTLTFVGLFPERVPEGRPVRCAVLRESRHFTFNHAPLGRWYLLAQSVSADRCPPGLCRDHADRPVAVATAGPITIRPGKSISTELALRPGRALDPPVLLALLDVRTYALSRLAEQSRPTEEYGVVA